MRLRLSVPLALAALGCAFGWMAASGRLEALARAVRPRGAQPPPAVAPTPVVDGSILPFPPTPSASVAGPTIAESTYKWRQEPKRLAPDAPNVVIILIDDAGPGLPDTYGGEVHTPTLSRVHRAGVSYNRFHSTAMCSPTRASLLTGRNHTRVCSGQITELANDWDGFSGTIPKSAATGAEVLKDYGYSTAAFGKWHNTPANHTTTKGPFDCWPTGYGFEYFYGFLAGESSQYEPRLIRNTTEVRPPKTPEQGYHLSEDLADDAVHWLREQRAFAPEKPFFVYWAAGAAHGPHQVMKEWADKYKGKFDDGWDAYRDRTFKRQKDLGWIPPTARLTPRDKTMAAWADVPEAERPFQRRLMEVYAGFAEHADTQAGKIVDELERLGVLDNTLIFYVWGDNGSSAEGQGGSISELLAQNQIPTTTAEQIAALDRLGGLPVLGSPKTDNMYHAGWAWAGGTPYKGTKLMGSHFGGTRQPMAVSWPKAIRPDATPRPQFHHVNDIVPTVYDVLKVTPPRFVNGVPQDALDGVSMAYSFNDPKAKGTKATQFFDIMGSRGVYHDGWFACTFGPRVPWLTVTPGIAAWTPDKDKWELYNLDEDWTQANDLAAQMPEKVSAMKELFMVESAKNKNLPIGGGLFAMFNPDKMISSPLTAWKFPAGVGRMPEFSAPKIGRVSNVTTADAEFPANANGVLFALGGFSGGLTCYAKDGELCYEYNLFEITRTTIKSKEKVAAGRHKVEVELKRLPPAGALKHLVPGEVTIRVDGREVAKGTVPTLVVLAFTANDCFDIGTDLGSPVSEAYYDKAPFRFSGKIGDVTVRYTK